MIRIHCSACDVVWTMPPRIIMDRPTLEPDDVPAWMRWHSHTHVASCTLTLARDVDPPREGIEVRHVDVGEVLLARAYSAGVDAGIASAVAAVTNHARRLTRGGR